MRSVPPSELDEKVELLAACRMEFKGGVRAKKNFGADAKLECVLAVEVRKANTAPVGGDERMHDEVGKGMRVVMVADREFGEVPLCRRGGMLAVE